MAKKSGYADQKILGQGRHFRRMFGEVRQVVSFSVDLREHHPALHTTLERRWLIEGKIDGGAQAQQTQNLPERPFLLRLCLWALLRIRHVCPADRRVATDSGKLLGNSRRFPDEIDAPSVNRVLRHRSELRRGPVLRQGDTSSLFDGLESTRPIGTCSREQHPNSWMLDVLGERQQERINREVLPSGGGLGHDMQVVV